MSFDLTQKIKVVNPTSNIDELYGPYTSVANALAGVPIVLRQLGRTVGIIEGGTIKEYWFKNGTTNSDLVEKGGEGTTVESYIEITKSQLDSHIANSTLKPGVLYGIKETERWMLLGDSTDTLFLRAVSTNQLETKGTGKFFVPKYDQNIDGYGIWQGEVYEAFPTTVPVPTYTVNDKVIWGGRLWNNVSGNLGTKVDIYTLSLDWEAIPFNETDYNVRFDKIDYDYQNDMVVYRKDNSGNEISTSYEDWYYKENNYFDGNPLEISLWNSLKIYQWGNEYSSDTLKGCGFNVVTNSILECLNTCGSICYNTLNRGSINSNTLSDNGGIFSNTLDSGNIEFNIVNQGEILFNNLNDGKISYNIINYGGITYNIINKFSVILRNTISGNIEGNILNNSSTIASNIIYGGINANILNDSGIVQNTFVEISAINHCTLNNGNIELGSTNEFNNKTIQYLTINYGDIRGDTGIDLSSATLISANFTREVFKDSAGVTKIRYVDGSGATVIADITA